MAYLCTQTELYTSMTGLLHRVPSTVPYVSGRTPTVSLSGRSPRCATQASDESRPSSVVRSSIHVVHDVITDIVTLVSRTRSENFSYR